MSEKNTYKFPSNYKEFGDFIVIKSYEYVPFETPSLPKVTPTTTTNNNTNTQTISTSTTVAESVDRALKDAINSTNNTQNKITPSNFTPPNAVGRFIKNPINAYYLPMPNDLIFADGQSWEAQNVGGVGKLGGNALKSFFASNPQVSSLAEDVRVLAESGMSDFAMAILKNFLGSGATANFLTQQSTGMVLNPYREQVFNGMQMRAFTFVYKLVPSSKEESDILRNLIKSMRRDSLPETTETNTIIEKIKGPQTAQTTESTTEPSTTESDSVSTSGSFELPLNSLKDRWFKVPRVFEIKFYTTANSTNQAVVENTKIPKIKPCICKNITVNYTPDNSWATRIDGSPIATELTLEFEEIEIIVSQDIALNY